MTDSTTEIGRAKVKLIDGTIVLAESARIEGSFLFVVGKVGGGPVSRRIYGPAEVRSVREEDW